MGQKISDGDDDGALALGSGFAKEVEGFAGGAFPGETGGAGEAGFTHFLTPGGAGEHLLHGGGELLDGLGINLDGGVADDFGYR